MAARRQPVRRSTPEDSGEKLTIHGGVGEVPVASDAKKFKMIVPMRPDERQEAEKAGKGATRGAEGVERF